MHRVMLPDCQHTRLYPLPGKCVGCSYLASLLTFGLSTHPSLIMEHSCMLGSQDGRNEMPERETQDCIFVYCVWVNLFPWTPFRQKGVCSLIKKKKKSVYFPSDQRFGLTQGNAQKMLWIWSLMGQDRALWYHWKNSYKPALTETSLFPLRGWSLRVDT